MLNLLLYSGTPVSDERRKGPRVREHSGQASINRCVLEKEGNALAIVRPSARLGKLFMVSKRLLLDLHATYSRTYVNGLDTIAQLLLVLMRDSVGDDDLLELASIQGFDRISTQYAMCDNGVHILCAFRY
jgi:hypothetical protein